MSGAGWLVAWLVACAVALLGLVAAVVGLPRRPFVSFDGSTIQDHRGTSLPLIDVVAVHVGRAPYQEPHLYFADGGARRSIAVPITALGVLPRISAELRHRDPQPWTDLESRRALGWEA